MIIQLKIFSFQYILKDKRIDIGQGKSVLVHSKDKISFVDSQMDKHPKSISLGVSKDQKISYDEVDSLSVAHRWEVIRYSFEYVLENYFFLYFELKSSI